MGMMSLAGGLVPPKLRQRPRKKGRGDFVRKFQWTRDEPAEIVFLIFLRRVISVEVGRHLICPPYQSHSRRHPDELAQVHQKSGSRRPSGLCPKCAKCGGRWRRQRAGCPRLSDRLARCCSNCIFQGSWTPVCSTFAPARSTIIAEDTSAGLWTALRAPVTP